MGSFSKKSDEDRSKVLRESIELISKKWHPQIVYKLNKGYTRFSELESKLEGISSKVLSSSLSDLDEKGLVSKSEKGYTLTSKGLEMKSALDSMADWGQKFSDASEVDILVIEDEHLQRNMYERWLEHHNVEDTSDLDEVYSLVTEDTDVVLMDRIVEGGKADDIARDLKNEFADMEIIMITAVDPEPDILELEVDYYLIKPVKEKELLDIVNGALEKSNKTKDKKELLSLASKKAVLDKRLAIDDREKYDELKEKIERLSSELEGSEDILSQFDV